MLLVMLLLLSMLIAQRSGFVSPLTLTSTQSLILTRSQTQTIMQIESFNLLPKGEV